MAGFPWHGFEDHLRPYLCGIQRPWPSRRNRLEQNLRTRGHRVYTPGSLYEEGLLNGDEQLFAAVVLDPDALGLAASTPRRKAPQPMPALTECYDEDELLRWQPSELVVSPKDASDEGLGRLFPLMESTMVSQHKLSPGQTGRASPCHVERGRFGASGPRSRPACHLGHGACSRLPRYGSSSTRCAAPGR